MSRKRARVDRRPPAAAAPTLRPLVWSRVPEWPDVPALDAADLACLRDVRAVLARHGRLERFALQLVHRHFALGDDEVLVETTDTPAREHRIRVAARTSAEVAGARPTAWLLGAPDARPLAWCVCEERGGQGHTGRHRSG